MTKNPIVWKEEKLNKAVNEVIKLISFGVKEDVWFNYTVCFKKQKNGEIIIRNPESEEIGQITKL